MRELLKLGLATAAIDAGANVKSSRFGVFGRGPDGHTQPHPERGSED